jgi:hypothetical protein
MDKVVLSAIVVPLFFCSAAYIFLVKYLINNYLPQNQTAAWVQLGRPLFQQPLFRAGNWQEDLRKWIRTSQFILWTNEYTRLKDAKLARLISSIRMLFVGAIALWAMLLTFGLTHQQ